jgi:hypothetical protein
MHNLPEEQTSLCTERSGSTGGGGDITLDGTDQHCQYTI